MDFWIGTTNKGKLSEMKILLEKAFPGVVIHSLSELPHYSQPPENGKTCLDNARIKAKSVKVMKPGVWVIAEDSGLEVEALGGLPGIHSARYAGPHARDSENIAKLLKMLQIRSAGNRKAKFVCQMVVFDPAGQELLFSGEMQGLIGQNPVGLMGFGYDPVFVPEGEKQSLAELGPGFKNKHSHRAKAIMALIEQIKSNPAL